MNVLNHILKVLFFLLVIRPIVLIYIGLNVRFGDRLPLKGPALLVANHNSHLDTVVLMSLFPLGMLNRVRPVAAADYFLKGRFRSWFATRIIGIIPIQRKAGQDNPDDSSDKLQPLVDALEANNIVIFFPEGTRGEPEKLGRFKKGIGLLAERCPNVPVVPVYLNGLGKALPRGESLLIPFFCDVFIAEPVYGRDFQSRAFVGEVKTRISAMAQANPHLQEREDDDLYF